MMPKTSDDLWDEMLLKHLQRLSRKTKKRPELAADLQYKNFKATIEHLSRDAKTAEFSDRLRPVVKYLDIFVAPISNLVQAQSNPCSLIWGTIQIVLVVSNAIFERGRKRDLMHFREIRITRLLAGRPALCINDGLDHRGFRKAHSVPGYV